MVSSSALTVLANVFERRQGDAIEHGNIIFRDFQRHFKDLDDRLDRQSVQPMTDHRYLMEVIDARFTAFAQRLEANRSDISSEQAIRRLEARFADISTRLAISSTQVTSIEPDLIRSLEVQISELSAHLTRSSTP